MKKILLRLILVLKKYNLIALKCSEEWSSDCGVEAKRLEKNAEKDMAEAHRLANLEVEKMRRERDSVIHLIMMTIIGIYL